MTTLALLLVFPLAWPIVAKLIWKHEITLPEIAANVAIGSLIVVVGWFAGRYAMTHDVEILNGQVTSKYSERVSCEHSYRCRCRETCTGSGKDRRCSETCDTCYEHSYDVDWNLRTTLGEIEIDRVNRQGTQEPPRYTAAQAGDPVAKASAYTNYIKGAPDSLFNAMGEKQLMAQYKDRLLPYPDDVYDYHYVDRVLTQGVAVPDLAQWRRDLANRLRDLGAAKQVNFVVVFSKENDPQYANALNAHWLGGKKNDVVVVLGTPKYPEIAWVRVFSWTKQEIFKVQLRDALLDMKQVDRQAFFDTLTQHVQKGYVRRPMSDFQYLEHQIEPPGWVIGLLVALSVVGSIAASVFLARNTYRSGGYGGYGGVSGRFKSAFPASPFSNRRRVR